MNNTITTTIKKIAFMVSFVLVLTNVGFGQETANWYFGSPNWTVNTGIRIDFSSGVPVVSSCVPIRTEEGSSSISTASGQPLFYTDGITVWDAVTNAVLPGGSGLSGGSSSTQSGIIMPKPGSTTQWLLFTSGANGSPGTTYYTVTGTTPTGPFSVGSGTTLAAAGVVGEGLFIIGSTKVGSSFWVIARDNGSTGQVRAWDVSNTGVVTTAPVLSTLSGAGFTNTNFNQTIGTIKSNTCQNMLAFTYFNGVVDITGFDAAIGKVTATAKQFSVGGTSYGIEFSSNDSCLYATSLSGGDLYRYKINTGVVTLMQHVSGEAGQLQSAPDGKIYMARNTGNVAPTYLGGITNPGLISNTFNPTEITINAANASCGAATGWVYRGLPTFPKSLVVTSPNIFPGDGAYCTGASVPVSYIFAGTDVSRTWTVTPAAGSSFTTNTATDKNPTITFSAPGNYKIKVDIIDACSRHYKDSMNFAISDPKNPTGSVTCSSGNLVLDNLGSDPDEPKYIWYKNSVATSNIMGTGTPLSIPLGPGAVLPTQICVGVADATPVATTTTNHSVAASNPLASIQRTTPYTSPDIDVLSTTLLLKSFKMGFRFAATISLTVTIKQGATTVYTQTTSSLAVPAGSGGITIPVNTTLLKGTGYSITVSTVPSGLELQTDNQDSDLTNAGEITYHASLPANSARAGIANLIYDTYNTTVTPVCSNPVCFPVGCVLPVEWLDFTAHNTSNGVLLNWSTASEINNDYFEIERSTDGVNFTVIGKVKGNGNSSLVHEYSYTDSAPSSGINYYRIVQHDYDGIISYTKIVTVTIDMNEFTVSPNPSSSTFNISFSNQYGGELAVLDILGKEVAVYTINSGAKQIEIGADLAKGMYIVRYSSTGGVSAQRLIKE